MVEGRGGRAVRLRDATTPARTIGLTHNFNEVLQVRPEIGYYHSYDVPAFDLGTRRNMVLYGFDMTLRF